MASFKAALGSGVSEIGITAAFTVNEDVNLNGKKIYPASKYTGSPKCVAAGKPMLTIGKSVNLGNGRIENMNLTLSAIDSSVKFFTGGGTLKDTSISYVTDKWGYLFEVSGSTVNLEGTNKITLSTSADVNYGYTSFKGGSTLNISGPLTISGNPSLSFKFEEASKLNVKSTGSVTYNAGGNFSVFEGNKGSHMTFDGPVNISSNAGNPYYKDGHYIIFYMWNSGLSLNASGNVLKGRSIFKVSVDQNNTNNAFFNINGSTTINATKSTDVSIFNIDHGNYYDPNKFIVNISAPLTVTGLSNYTGDGYGSDASILFKILDATVNINSTVTTNGGMIHNLRGTMNISSSGYINGISKYLIETSGKMGYTAGARIRLGGVCKKATKTETKTGSSKTYYKMNATSANNLGSPFTGGC